MDKDGNTSDSRENSVIAVRNLHCVSAKADSADDNNLPSDYCPTPAEQKLLETLLSPENRHKTITEICRASDVSRDIYYYAFQKPGFKALYRKMIIEMVKQQAAPVINTFLREAKRGSFQHGKVILEMAEIYSEKPNQPEIPSININIMVANQSK